MTIEDTCLWYRNKSIPKNNPVYEQCWKQCQRYNKKCIMYLPINTYKEHTKHLGEKNEQKRTPNPQKI